MTNHKHNPLPHTIEGLNHSQSLQIYSKPPFPQVTHNYPPDLEPLSVSPNQTPLNSIQSTPQPLKPPPINPSNTSPNQPLKHLTQSTPQTPPINPSTSPNQPLKHSTQSTSQTPHPINPSNPPNQPLKHPTQSTPQTPYPINPSTPPNQPLNLTQSTPQPHPINPSTSPNQPLNPTQSNPKHLQTTSACSCTMVASCWKMPPSSTMVCSIAPTSSCPLTTSSPALRCRKICCWLLLL